jgi:hypothetical protein
MAEFPMFALILTDANLPMPMGSSLPARWWMLATMTRRPGDFVADERGRYSFTLGDERSDDFYCISY